MAACLGQHCDTCIDSSGNVLDVDYVATTFLSSNVHGLRHNYFHLNRCALGAPEVLSRFFNRKPSALAHLKRAAVIMNYE
jgi:hypothetical protein